MKRVKKIDVHVHASESKWLMGKDTPMATPEELIEIYDSIGVERGVIMSLNNLLVTTSNYEAKTIADKYPDRFSWFCTFCPMQGNNSKDTDFMPFLQQCKDSGAKGVGEFTSNIPFDDERTLNFLSQVEKIGFPLTFHIGSLGNDYGIVDDIDLSKLENALKTFPNLKFLGHSQKFWSHVSKFNDAEDWNKYGSGKVIEGRVVELMRKYPNLLGDLSAGSGYFALTRDPEFAYKFLEEFSDRLYYGTDIVSIANKTSPMLRLAEFLDTAMETGKISYDTYYKVCRGNAIKLLGLNLDE